MAKVSGADASETLMTPLIVEDESSHVSNAALTSGLPVSAVWSSTASSVTADGVALLKRSWPTPGSASVTLSSNV